MLCVCKLTNKYINISLYADSDVVDHHSRIKCWEKTTKKRERRPKERKPKRKRPENQFQIGQPIFSLKNSRRLWPRTVVWLEKFTLSISAVLWFSCFGTNNLSNQCRSCFLSPVFPIHLPPLADPRTVPFFARTLPFWSGFHRKNNGVLSAVHFQNE